MAYKGPIRGPEGAERKTRRYYTKKGEAAEGRKRAAKALIEGLEAADMVASAVTLPGMAKGIVKRVVKHTAKAGAKAAPKALAASLAGRLRETTAEIDLLLSRKIPGYRARDTAKRAKSMRPNLDGQLAAGMTSAERSRLAKLVETEKKQYQKLFDADSSGRLREQIPPPPFATKAAKAAAKAAASGKEEALKRIRKFRNKTYRTSPSAGGVQYTLLDNDIVRVYDEASRTTTLLRPKFSARGRSLRFEKFGFSKPIQQEINDRFGVLLNKPRK